MKLCASILVTVLLAQQFGSAQEMVCRAALDAARTPVLDARAAHLERIRKALAAHTVTGTSEGSAGVGHRAPSLGTLDYRPIEQLATQSSQGSQQQSGGSTRKVVLIVVFSLVALVMIGSAFLPSSSNNPGPAR